MRQVLRTVSGAAVSPVFVIGALAVVAMAAMMYLVIVSFSLSSDVAEIARQNADVADRAEEIAMNNTKRFCAIRQNTDRQIHAQRVFIQEHPNGIPGISISDIEASMQRMIDFREAIGELENCPSGLEESP